MECFSFIKNVIPHAIAVVCDKKSQIIKQHDNMPEENLAKIPKSMEKCQSKVSEQTLVI